MEIVTEKRCSKCKEIKSFSEYFKQTNGKHGLKSYCKECCKIYNLEWYHKNPENAKESKKRWVDANKDKRKEYQIKYKDRQRESQYQRHYGITTQDYEEMFSNQNGVCAACGNPQTKRLFVDHSHETGEVRGLLCHNCNAALGHAKDNVKILNNLIGYLNEHSKSF